ncbi:hypothetical protein [Tenacibaculum halocynthiae]|uniref:hypothetical protein n=1 Tax=Tenacibaculum halocynthiae TaxID=1254437 RepID=UPI0038962EA5
MGYRIFYSYQSDLKNKLNRYFIRNAINAAIYKITEFEIEPLIEGFYGISGNPPLAETMLEQSKGADIFIGDMTFTMSKVWHNPSYKFEDDKSILIEIPKGLDLKPAPNPNVLLETGYSWALKDYERTILILNTAFGSSADLPVDMGSLRWPIEYNLCEDRFSNQTKLNKETDGLVNALEVAIREAINSNIKYQIKYWRPFIIYSQWRKDHIYPYKITVSLKTKIKEFRELLKTKNKIRLTGKKGSGKTRFVLEALQEHEEMRYDSLAEQIIYHDYEGATAGDISIQLTELKNLNQHKIFIADNCSYLNHSKLIDKFKRTNVKIITIASVEDVQQTDNANIFIEEKITIEVFEEIIKEKFGTEKVSEIIEYFDSNLDEFIDRIFDGIGKENIDVSNIEYLKLLLGEYWIEKGALKFLFALAFFKQIGVTGIYKKEINFIREVFIDCSE